MASFLLLEVGLLFFYGGLKAVLKKRIFVGWFYDDSSDTELTGGVAVALGIIVLMIGVFCIVSALEIMESFLSS